VRVPRIGFLANVRSPATEGFQRGLRDLGYVEGQTIIVEGRLAEERFERLSAALSFGRAATDLRRSWAILVCLFMGACATTPPPRSTRV
jgi:hypothetical protein